MKKYKTIALSLLLGFSLAACSDFLEFDPLWTGGQYQFLENGRRCGKGVECFP